ncbi:MAG: S1/P1 nuclease [Prevotella sp.]|nr:S1/P1 nuclease [Prevotella sp.]
MKVTYRLLVFALSLFVAIPDLLAWGQKGHDVTCEIAERHLDRGARKAVKRLLEGKSMVYWGNWLDNASHTDEYAYTKTWHYKNIEAGVKYEDAQLEPQGDVVTAINRQVMTLKDKMTSTESKRLALKMLIHLVGDLHQPMHMGRKADLGGNLWMVMYFGKEKKLHGIWDTDILEGGHKWSYEEWATEIDCINRKQRKEICRGTVDDWAQETYTIASEVYNCTPQQSKLSYDYQARWIPVIEQQLLKGGVRLAYLLNEIF